MCLSWVGSVVQQFVRSAVDVSINKIIEWMRKIERPFKSIY